MKVFYLHADVPMISLTVATWATTTILTTTPGKFVGDLFVLYVICFVNARSSLQSVSVRGHWRVYVQGSTWSLLAVIERDCLT